jgi:hypothetical protein
MTSYFRRLSARVAAFGLAACSVASAATLDIRIPGGRFEDCELVGFGEKGSVMGSMTLSELDSDPRWAPSMVFILTDDSKFQTLLRFGLRAVTTSSKLEVRYEFFAGNRRPVAEAIFETPAGVPLPIALTWNESGLVELAAGSAEPRKLLLDFKPTRAFVLISGGRGRLTSDGGEQLDCSRNLSLDNK